MMKSYLECYEVKFVDGERKVVVLPVGDGGIETYDLEKWEKWRFARPNIGPPFGGDSGDNEEEAEDNIQKPRQKGQVEKKRRGEPENQLVNGAYPMAVWEDQKKGTIFYAIMDGDAVRIWNVPMTKENALEHRFWFYFQSSLYSPLCNNELTLLRPSKPEELCMHFSI